MTTPERVPEPIPAQGHDLIELAVRRFVLRASLARATTELARLEAELVDVEAELAAVDAAWAAMERDAQAAA